MRSICFRCILVIVSVLLMNGFFSSSQTWGEDNFVIGHSVAYTGATAESGAEIQRGMRTAFDEIKENGGINGYPLDYVWLDDQLEKVQAVNNFRKLAAMPNVVAIATGSTGTALASKPLAERFKVIQINGGSIGKWPQGLGEWSFRTTIPDNVTVPMLLKAMKTKFSVKKVGMIFDYKDDWSVLCKPIYEKAVKDLGLESPLEPQSFGRGDSDFSAILTKLKGESLDAIFMPIQIREGSLILKQARGLGVKAMFCGTSGYISIAGLSAAGEAADGVVGVTYFHPSSKRPAAQNFYKRFKKLWPDYKVQSYLDPTAYDTIMLTAEAIRRANIKPPVTVEDRIKIRDAFGKIKGWEGATGTFSYDGPGDALPRDMILIRFNAKTNLFDVID